MFWITIRTPRTGTVKHAVHRFTKSAALAKMERAYPGGFELICTSKRKGEV